MTDQAAPIARDQVADLLGHGLDAQAHNSDQEILLFNPSPEPDSMVEHLNLLFAELHQAGVGADRIADLMTITRKVIESNAKERGSQQNVCGELDRWLIEMQVGGKARHALTVKGIAQRLRMPLQVFADIQAGKRVGNHDLLEAAHAIREVQRLVPEHRLLTDTVANELGPVKYRTLQRLVEGHA